MLDNISDMPNIENVCFLIPIIQATYPLPDINECERNQGQCVSKVNSECNNLPGTYECTCSLGYYETDPSTCQGIAAIISLASSLKLHVYSVRTLLVLISTVQHVCLCLVLCVVLFCLSVSVPLPCPCLVWNRKNLKATG